MNPSPLHAIRKSCPLRIRQGTFTRALLGSLFALSSFLLVLQAPLFAGIKTNQCKDRQRIVRVLALPPYRLELHEKPEPQSNKVYTLADEEMEFTLGHCLVVAGYRTEWCHVSSQQASGWINSFHLVPVKSSRDRCERQDDPDRVVSINQDVRTEFDVKNWKSEALKHIRLVESSLDLKPLPPTVFFSSAGWRCPRLNNYWCIKSRKGGWTGQIGRDNDGHAKFKNASYGAAAVYELLRIYNQEKEKKTLSEILCTYAPPSDCIGSRSGRDDQNTCAIGSNDCTFYAKSISTALGVCANCDLELFDKNGEAKEIMVRLMGEISRFEISHPAWGLNLSPTHTLIRKGIELHDGARVKNSNSTHKREKK